MFKHILVATDGSSLANKAGSTAVKLAKEYNAGLFVLSVAEPYPYGWAAEAGFYPDAERYEKEVRKQAEDAVGMIAAEANKAAVRCETLTTSNTSPSNEIIRIATERGCDLIVVASHGRHGLERLLLGSVTQKLLLKSSLPVLVVR